MKKKFLLIAILFSCKIGFGQAPVIDSTWLPKAGDKYYIYNLTGPTIVDIPIVQANDTGANVTWDFNTTFYIIQNKSDSFDFVLPGSRNIICSNQTANFASGNANFFYCYIKNSNGLFIADSKANGGNGIGPVIDYYTKPVTFLKTNLKFRQQFYDTSGGYYYTTAGHTPTDSNWHEIFKRHFVYDGYGTLKLGGKVFDSAIRIRETGVVIDSLYSGNSYTKAYTLESNYNWYIPSIHAPILTVNRGWGAIPKGSGYDTNKSIPPSRYQVLSLPVNESVAALFPPPATFNNTTATMAVGYIDVHNAKGNDIVYSLYDVQGKLLASGKPNSPRGDDWQIPVAALNIGTYILKLQNNSGQTTSIKLIKDH